MNKVLIWDDAWIEYVINSNGLIFKALEPQVIDNGKQMVVCACGHVLRTEGDEWDTESKVIAGNCFRCPSCWRSYVSPIIEVGRYDAETKQVSFTEPVGEIDVKKYAQNIS